MSDVLFLPDELYPTSMDCNLEFNSVIYRSPYDNSEQIQRRPGERWVFKFSYDDLEQDQAKDLQGFLVSLRGVAGKFYAKDFAFFQNRGTIAGSPKVDGSSNTGGICNIKDCFPNQLILRRGDYVKIGTRLHMMTQDIRSGQDGKAQLVFQPRIIQTPSDNSPIIYNDFTVVCRLKDDKQARRSSRDMSNGFSFECIEVMQ